MIDMDELRTRPDAFRYLSKEEPHIGEDASGLIYAKKEHATYTVWICNFESDGGMVVETPDVRWIPVTEFLAEGYLLGLTLIPEPKEEALL